MDGEKSVGRQNRKDIYEKLISARNGGIGIVLYDINSQKVDFKLTTDKELHDLSWVLYESQHNEIEARAGGFIKNLML